MLKYHDFLRESSVTRTQHVVSAGGSPPGPLHVRSVKERRRTQDSMTNNRELNVWKLKKSSQNVWKLNMLISTRMTNYPALANFRTFNIDGVKCVLLLLWDIIKIELESFLERTNPYGSYQEETTDRCKLSGTLFVDVSFSFWEEVHSETSFSGPKDKIQTMRAPSIILTRFQFDSSSSLIMGQPLPILLDLFCNFLSKTLGAFCMLCDHAIHHRVSLALVTRVHVRDPPFFY
eukprot:scaffold77866_cov53-Attheya_sp.AAC.1